jgi:hypothetical protein
MDVIKDMLREELDNSLRIRERYIEELDKIPKGCLRTKVISGHEYLYRVYRQGYKVKVSYVGKPSAAHIEKHQKNLELRKTYKESIKKLDQQIRYLRKVINVRTK